LGVGVDMAATAAAAAEGEDSVDSLGGAGPVDVAVAFKCG